MQLLDQFPGVVGHRGEGAAGDHAVEAEVRRPLRERVGQLRHRRARDGVEVGRQPRSVRAFVAAALRLASIRPNSRSSADFPWVPTPYHIRTW
jgi:hypothetical protein